MNCENCGAPLTSATPGTSVTCTHCGRENAVPGGSTVTTSSRGGGSGGSSRSGSEIPAIVVVTAPSAQATRPVIIVRRNGGYRYRTHFSLFGFLLTMAIFYGVYYYSMRLRNNVAASVNAAEHGAEHGAEHDKKKK